MIPRVAAEKLAVFCDIWCDEGYYTAGECRRILTRALEFGIKPKIHTGAYSYIGGADMAAEIGAVSAAHLNYTPVSALKKLAAAGIPGVLLPGTISCVGPPQALPHGGPPAGERSGIQNGARPQFKPGLLD
jgi:imidazolonepropionase